MDKPPQRHDSFAAVLILPYRLNSYIYPWYCSEPVMSGKKMLLGCSTFDRTRFSMMTVMVPSSLVVTFRVPLLAT